jgi:AbrB family looped-hinge helix DNA binding protein
MEPVTIRRKGQLTLPAELRKEMDLNEGDVIYFVRRGKDTLLIRAEDIIARTAGALSEYATDTPLEWDREAVWGEMAMERENRVLKQIAEESESYDPD